MVSYVSVMLYGVGGIVVAGMERSSWPYRRGLFMSPSFLGSRRPTPSPPPASDWHMRTSGSLPPMASGSTRGLSSYFPIAAVRRSCSFRRMLEVLEMPNDFWCGFHRYGASDGYPSQHGIIRDAQAALDHLHSRNDIDTSRIVVFGRSLGGAVGAVLTKNNPDKVAALILENTFTSILDMAGVLLPFLKCFIGKSTSKGPRILNFLVRSPWNTIDVVGEIRQPILFLSGLRDEMVPPIHMQLLYAKAAARNKNCLFVEFPNGMHMDTWLSGGDRYWRHVHLFLEQHSEESGAQAVPER